MKNLVLAGAVAGLMGVSAISSAVFVNLNLDNPDQVVTVGSTATLTFTGTIDVGAGVDAGAAGVEYAGLTVGGPYLSGVSFDSGFLTYLGASNAGVDYSGALFTITLSGSEAAGWYAFNPLPWGADDNLSEFYVDATMGNVTARDSELYSVDIQPVPEPASMAALMVGAAALVRKRKK